MNVHTRTHFRERGVQDLPENHPVDWLRHRQGQQRECLRQPWLGQRTKSSTSTDTALGSDDSIADKESGVEENHEGFVMVVYAGGDVKKVNADELPEGRVLPKRLVNQAGE